MKLYALGTGGWIPTARRHTCTYLLEDKNQIILLDTGTGVSRLDEYRYLIDKHDTINIIYSHYHLDHVIGLAYLPNWLSDKEIRIWGPGNNYYGKTCYEILSTITSSPYFSLPVSNFSRSVVIRDYDLNGFELGSGIKVKICEHWDLDTQDKMTILLKEYENIFLLNDGDTFSL